MDKLAEDRTEMDESKDFRGFRSPTPSEESHEDEEDHKETRAPLSVSVTHSGKMRVMELRGKPRTRRHEVLQMLLSSNALTRIQGAAQRCPSGPDSPIKLKR